MAKGGIGGIGFGLDSLFEDNSIDVNVKNTLRLSEIEPNREQPRKSFSDEALNTLADSIHEHGMLQPIVVRPLPDGQGYQIVAGERRWRAARMLGLGEVPVIIKELSDIQTMQIALIENLQRENLNPIEEANGYDCLIQNFDMSKEKVAKIMGKSRSYISNCIRILSLDKDVLSMIEQNELSMGHAKTLLSFEDKELMLDVANRAKNGGLTVRQVEQLAKKSNEALNSTEEIKSNAKIDSYFTEMELSLNERLGRKVKVDYGKNKGVLILEFYDKEDLSAIAEKLV